MNDLLDNNFIEPEDVSRETSQADFSELVIPTSFEEAMSYEQQIIYLYQLFTDYEKGVSPEVTIEDIPGGHRITITDADHPDGQSFDVMDGESGQDGRDGQDGQDGISPTVTITSITNGHRVTITDADHPQGQSFDVMNGEKGDKGDKGDRGETGESGFSPEVTITQITGGHRISITDADGTQTFDVMDGQDGQAIPPVITALATIGSGTGTPSVTVTKSGTDEAPTYTFAFDNLKGANGIDGVSPTVTIRSITGGHQIEIVSAGGTERFDVMDGTDGSDGTDGVSPTVTVKSITGGHQIEIVSAGGTERFDVMDGVNGTDGSDGQDGVAATIQVGTVTTGAAGTNASVTNSGTSSAAVFDFTIPRGADGQNGQDGATGPAGPGVASGGTAGQILAKASGSDYDTEWINPPSGGNTKGFIRFGDDNNNYSLDFTTDTVFNNLYTTSFVPNDKVISMGHVYYPNLLELEVSEVVSDPTIIIKPAGRISNSGWYPNISLQAYDATDGTNTLEQYTCFNLTCRFDNDNTKYIWDSSLSDIKTALLAGTTYPILFEPHLVPNMQYGTNDVKQVFISSGAGTLYYDSTSDDFVINISEISVFKATAGTVEIFTTYVS